MPGGLRVLVVFFGWFNEIQWKVPTKKFYIEFYPRKGPFMSFLLGKSFLHLGYIIIVHLERNQKIYNRFWQSKTSDFRAFNFGTLWHWSGRKKKHKTKPLAILCDLFGMVKWPLQRLSDLQLVDEKVTLDHLAFCLFFFGTKISRISTALLAGHFATLDFGVGFVVWAFKVFFFESKWKMSNSCRPTNVKKWWVKGK